MHICRMIDLQTPFSALLHVLIRYVADGEKVNTPRHKLCIPFPRFSIIVYVCTYVRMYIRMYVCILRTYIRQTKALQGMSYIRTYICTQQYT